MKIFAAPLQGYTDNAFIEIHHSVYGAPDAYCMPFSRIEKNQVRRQDVARLHRAVEIMSGAGVEIIPQMIFNSVEEFTTLVDAVKEAVSAVSTSTSAVLSRCRPSVDAGLPQFAHSI